MEKRKLICGNWKLNHLSSETKKILGKTVRAVGKVEYVKIALAPVTPLLSLAIKTTFDSNIDIAAQNVFYKEKGAFTGEWSVKHLKDLGCKYAIIGHSERRTLFGETDYCVAKKTLSCLKGGIIPIACIGETVTEHENRCTQNVIRRQVLTILDLLIDQNLAKLVLAYEPIWAIGTGKTATVSQVEKVHSLIRNLLIERFGANEAKKSYILYGGSVNSQNIAKLLIVPNIDGVLVGGASLTAESFCQLVQNARGQS